MEKIYSTKLQKKNKSTVKKLVKDYEKKGKKTTKGLVTKYEKTSKRIGKELFEWTNIKDQFHKGIR